MSVVNMRFTYIKNTSKCQPILSSRLFSANNQNRVVVISTGLKNVGALGTASLREQIYIPVTSDVSVHHCTVDCKAPFAGKSHLWGPWALAQRALR
jgi:hypothetical protein